MMGQLIRGDFVNTDVRAVRYSTVAIVLHWGIALLLIFQLGLGFRMEAAEGPAKFAVFQLHKSVGITLLLLVAIRLLWRMTRTPPAIEARPWEKALAHAVHAVLYLLLFALPISGWIIVSTSRIVVPTLLYGTVPWPHIPVPAGAREAWHTAGEFLHVNLVWVLIALFGLHLAGALKHHFLDRDGDIGKMAPGVKPGAWGDPRLLAIGVGVILPRGSGYAGCRSGPLAPSPLRRWWRRKRPCRSLRRFRRPSRPPSRPPRAAPHPRRRQAPRPRRKKPWP